MRAPVEASGRAQHLLLGIEIEPITRFHLDGGCALARHRLESRLRRGHQFVFARRPRRPHGGRDAAARPRNVFVAGAAHPRFPFGRPVTAENEMRVAIDQPRRHPGAAKVARLARARRFAARADPGNAAAFNRDGRVADGAIGHATRHGGNVATLKDKIDHRNLATLCGTLPHVLV